MIEPHDVAQADQAGAAINEAVDELIAASALMTIQGRQVAMLKDAGEEHEELEDALRHNIDEFIHHAREFPPNLSAAVIFELTDRICRGATVTIEDKRSRE